MGRNGSGKSTLLGRLAGLRRPTAGRVRVLGQAPADAGPERLVARVGLVPQDAGLLLYGESVAAECAAADRDAGLERRAPRRPPSPGCCPGCPATATPGDLSEGQRLAPRPGRGPGARPRPSSCWTSRPAASTTRARSAWWPSWAELAAAGHAVVVATHDVELVARVADRAVVLADGEVVADGPAREVVCHSPVFAPQVAKVLAPEPWLTVDEVRLALEAAPA